MSGGRDCNAGMGPAEVRVFCELDDAGGAVIKAALRQLGLSARAYHRVLKLAWTIADLAGSEGIEPQHLDDARPGPTRKRRATTGHDCATQ